MNYQENKEILFALLEAKTEDVVTKLIETHPFFKKCSWFRYGDDGSRPDFNNIGFIKAQAPEPVGALVEKITNGLDAVLIRKCLENKVPISGNGAPQTMSEAITRFYGAKYLDLGNLDQKEIQKLAANTVRITAEGDNEQPTITVIDFGEGQAPADFVRTFLSLGGSTKMKIKFVQGVYNQGGSAALQFSGENGYQLILSRRAPTIDRGERSDRWGFTLVRSRYAEGNKTDWYEYCIFKTPEYWEVPSFPYEPLKILPDKEDFTSGSLVRLYNYQLKQPSFITTQREGHLAREVNKKLFSMTLPVQFHELRRDLAGWEKGKNDITRIYGLWRLINKRAGQKNLIKEFLPRSADLGVFGLRKIEIVVLNDEAKEGEQYRKGPRVFLTVNGQTHHYEMTSFLKTKCLLPDLADYMIVHVDLSDAGYQAYKTLNTSRTGPVETRNWEIFHERLTNSIKGDERLKELDEEYRNRKLAHSQPEDKDLNRYISKLVQNNPFWAQLLNIGKEVPVEEPRGEKRKYKGKYIPTFFRAIGDPEKEIPINRYARIRIETDATNDYLTRNNDRGEVRWLPSRLAQISQYTLKDGIIPFRLDPIAGVKVGDTENIILELTRPGMESLKAEIKIKIGKHEEPQVKPKGEKRPPQTQEKNRPKLEKVYKADWPGMGPEGTDWTEEDIAKVNQTQENIIVYINADTRVLHEFPKINPRFSSGDAIQAIQRHYFAALYLYSVALFFEMKDKPEEREWVLPLAMKAVSKNLLDLGFPVQRSQTEE